MLVGQAIAHRFGMTNESIDTIVQVTPLTVGRADIPTIVFTHDRNPQGATPEEILRRPTRGYRRAKVVLLARDPRDVVVSLYFQKAKRKNLQDDPIERRPIGEFIRAERGGLRSVIAFYQHWLARKGNAGDVLLVRYEDLHRDPHGVLREVLTFAGIDGTDDATIDASVEAARFENMRKLEQSGQFKSEALTPGNDEDPESFKTRRGKVGGYHDYVTPEDEAWMAAEVAVLPSEFGYDQSKH